MTDYSELIKALREEAEWAEGNEWETPIMLSDHLKQAADVIEGLLSAKYLWISVKDKCPVPRTKVLVAYKRGVTIAEYRGFDTELVNGVLQKQYYWHGIKGAKDTFRSVTHWMPLPQPPRKEVGV